MRVLVLEESKQIADINCSYIAEKGGEAIWVRSCFDAYKALHKWEIDAAIIDVGNFRDAKFVITYLKTLRIRTCAVFSFFGDAHTRTYDVPTFNKMTPMDLFNWINAEVFNDDVAKPPSKGTAA